MFFFILRPYFVQNKYVPNTNNSPPPHKEPITPPWGRASQFENLWAISMDRVLLEELTIASWSTGSPAFMEPDGSLPPSWQPATGPYPEPDKSMYTLTYCFFKVKFWRAVSRWSLTAEARVRARVSPCGICGGQSGTGTGSSQSSSVFPCLYHSTVALSTPVHYLRDEQFASVGGRSSET
jgi:hypothetical protein